MPGFSICLLNANLAPMAKERSLTLTGLGSFSVNAISRSFLLLALVIFVTALVPIFGCPTGSQGQSDLTSRVVTLEGQVAALNAALSAVEAKLANVSVVQGDINGVAGPHLIIEGCNLHVRDGSGTTVDSKALNGLGNLIVGYNELPSIPQFGRTGSHNVVIGSEHEYTSFGGLVAGQNNSVTGAASSVSGGRSNEASGSFSNVSGGASNTAVGSDSNVSGGRSNEASGSFSSVSSGGNNTAFGSSSSVSGGTGNRAFGEFSSVSGGNGNGAAGTNASVSGGSSNGASGENSSVSGGNSRVVGSIDDWAAGTLFENN